MNSFRNNTVCTTAAAIALVCAAWLAACVGIACAQGAVQTLNPAIGAWLPDPQSGFQAWSTYQTSPTHGYDYFVCGSPRRPSEPKDSLDYAGAGCPLVKDATAFEYGPAGTKGNVVYDRAHSTVLYGKGCCLWRGFVLTANFRKPPQPITQADLSRVHTMRGVSLGMTVAQVEAIYGPAKAHPDRRTLSESVIVYTSLKGTPATANPATCGQFQSFFFQKGRLVSIELLTEC